MQKKYVLCFSGLGRSINYTFNNLQKFLIDDLKPTQIFLVTEDKYSSELKKVFNKYENLTFKIVENLGKVDSNLSFDSRWGPQHSKLNYLNFLYKRLVLSDLIKEHSKFENIEDHIFIYSRLDVVYKYRLSSQIKHINTNKKIYLPNFHHWLGGYNDRFALANYNNFITYLEVYKYLKDYNKDLDLHSEIITRHHFIKQNLKLGIIRLPFARIRENGEIFDNLDEFDTRLINPLNQNKHIYLESFIDSLRLLVNR